MSKPQTFTFSVYENGPRTSHFKKKCPSDADAGCPGAHFDKSLLCLTCTQSSQFSSVQLLSPVRLFGTPWSATQQASLFFTVSQSLLKLMTVELVMPSNYLILSPPSTPALSLSGKLQICIHKITKSSKMNPLYMAQ